MQGSVCLVPDWQSDDLTVGKKNLLASLLFCQRKSKEVGGDSDRIALCGWSLGAKAAADVLLHPQITGGWRPRAFVGMAGGYDNSPITSTPLDEDITTDTSVPCLLVHGLRDQVVPVERSREFFQSLRRWGWQVSLREVDTDHAGVIGARYDLERRRCVPSRDATRVLVVDSIAEWLSANSAAI